VTFLPLLPLADLTTRYWVHPWNRPYLIRFTENIGVYYYGLAYVLAFLLGACLLLLYARRGRSPLTRDQSLDFLFALVLGVMLGGRLGYFIFYTPEKFGEPLSLLRVWEGGMASHGGFLGVAVAAIWYGRTSGAGFCRLADLAATITPPGLLLGRLANFINGELWGKVTDVPWAIIFPQSDPHTPLHLILPRHPSQLYEAALEGLLLLVYLQLRFWRSRVTIERPGQLGGEFLLGYAVLRAICEVYREPDADLILGLSRGTFYSIFLVAAGVGMIVWSRWRKPATPAKR
jgi:phosphatidylglycerol---prolipoprotein diacylglyceryl transferase